MNKILKNTTNLDIELNESGLTIPALSSLELNVQDYILIASNDSISELTTLINSGNIVVNDGIQDLNVTEGINYLKYPDKAENIRFNNQLNGFISKEVQSAIEEAKITGIQFNEINCGNYLSSRNYKAFSAQAGQIINASSTPLILNKFTENSDTLAFNLSSGELTFLVEGDYHILYNVTFENTNNTRTNTRSTLEINKGNGFSEIEGTEVYTYERQANADRQTGSGTAFITVNKNDIIRITSRRIQGSNNTSLSEGCSISIIPTKPKTEEASLTIDCKETDDEIIFKYDAGEL